MSDAGIQLPPRIEEPDDLDPLRMDLIERAHACRKLTSDQLWGNSIHFDSRDDREAAEYALRALRKLIAQPAAEPSDAERAALEAADKLAAAVGKHFAATDESSLACDKEDYGAATDWDKKADAAYDELRDLLDAYWGERARARRTVRADAGGEGR